MTTNSTTSYALNCFFIAGFAAVTLLRGGNHQWTGVIIPVCAGLSLLGLGLSSTESSKKLKNRRLLVPAALWCIWLLWLAIQLLPLNYEIFDRHSISKLLGLDPTDRATGMISMTPDATVHFLLMSLAFFAAWCFGSQLFHSARQQKFALWLLFAISTAQALFGLYALNSGHRLDFLGESSHAHSNAIGTFANRNHFSAFLNLGVGIGIAILASKNYGGDSGRWNHFLRRLTSPEAITYLLIRVCLLTLVIGIIASHSRMGNISLAVALAVVSFIWIAKVNKLRSKLKAILLFATILAVDVVLVGSEFGLKTVGTRLAETTLETEIRAELNASLLPLALETQFYGSGAGSFSQIFARSIPRADFPRPNHAHNEYLQIVIETGWVGLAILAFLILTHLYIAVRCLDHPRRFGRCAGIAFIFATTAGLSHATTEFHFRMPAYALFFVILMSIVAGAWQSLPKFNTHCDRQTLDKLS